MQVLHLHWHIPPNPTMSGGMLLWAEDGNHSQPTSGKKLTKKVKPHPFETDLATLREICQPFMPENEHLIAKTLALWLPSVNTGPYPSPQVIHDWELDVDGSPQLHPWQLTGLWLNPAQAFQLLVNLPPADHVTPQLALGADLNYWQGVINLLLETLAAQKFLPFLNKAGGKIPLYHARWLPVLDGPTDSLRLGHLQEMMPPLCRAETNDLETAPSPDIILDTFLNTLTDTLVRRWSDGYYPKLSVIDKETAHEWIRALFNPSPLVSGTPAQVSHFEQNYQQWLRNLYVSGDKTFRVAFRLEAPQEQLADESVKAWSLHYLLQARDDPSLLVPAETVWNTQGNTLSTLNRHFQHPQEKLLTGLGYAARLFEPIRDGLKTATPTTTQLSTTEAFNFLRESAPLLENSGFGVLVPPWWNNPNTRLGVRLKIGNSNTTSPSHESDGKLGLRNLIRYKWDLSVGETPLSEAEFEALVALKSPLVQIRGQWVQLDSEQIEAAIRFWKKQALEGEATMQEALQLGLGTPDEVADLPVEGVEVSGWFEDWLKQFTERETLEPLPPPTGLQASLRPYQQYGYSWLHFLQRWGMGACLADDMGLGKTLETITLILRQKEDYKGTLPGPILVICPTSVVINWSKEIERFAPDLTFLIHQGVDRLREEKFIEQAKKVDMVLSSYAIIRRDAETVQKVAWFGIILDEAQNIKNPQTKQTRAIRKLPADYRIALTGTPVENRLSELWSIMQFLNPGYLGSHKAFQKNFARTIERYGDEDRITQLKQMIGPFILRRVKTDPNVIQDLPEKQETKVYCNLSLEQASLYEAVVQDVLEKLETASAMQRRGLVLSMLMKLKQICNHPAQFLHQISDAQAILPDPEEAVKRSGKLTRLLALLEEVLAVEDKALIFTQFAEMGKYLKSTLQQTLGVSTLFLHGGTPAKKRAKMVENFQENRHGPPIFILSLKAGGTGLNLTAANHVFHFDRWWNPAVEDQATDRAFRIGQVQNVQVHKFVCTGTLEEKIDDMIESKKALAQSVVGAGENWLTELSTDDLRDMVILRREALQ